MDNSFSLSTLKSAPRKLDLSGHIRSEISPEERPESERRISATEKSLSDPSIVGGSTLKGGRTKLYDERGGAKEWKEISVDVRGRVSSPSREGGEKSNFRGQINGSLSHRKSVTDFPMSRDREGTFRT